MKKQLNLSDLLIWGQCEDEDHNLIKLLDEYKISVFGMQCLKIWDLDDLVSFLQHENTRFRFLENITINNGHLYVDNLLKKHVEQLTYLELNSYVKPKIPHHNPDLPKFSNLKTLYVLGICSEDLVSLLYSCSESLSKLSLCDISEEVPNILLKQLPELPKLQTIQLLRNSFGEIGKSVISKCRQTLTGLVFHMDFEMEDTYFPKLTYLEFNNVPNLDLMEDIISANACQLESLVLLYIHDFMLPNQQIKNVYAYRCDNLANILQSASSLQCLVLEDYQASDFRLKGIKKMPNLTDFYLLIFKHDGNWFIDECITDLLVKNADTLEFLVLDENYHSSTTKIEIMESMPPVELKKVHTLIYLHYKPLLGCESDFFKLLCPNAQIMIKDGDGGEYINETVKSRLKYLKAEDVFCDYLYDTVFDL